MAGRTPSSEGAEWGREPPEAWGTLHRGTDSEVIPSERGRWDQFYEQFAGAVRGTGPVPVDPWDALATATVLDAARRSAADGPASTCRRPHGKSRAPKSEPTSG